MKPHYTIFPRPLTARRRVVATLAQEILDNPSMAAFPIASEYQLCQRFNVSRVTVRLALSDLENRGLIYRKHGVGTFAHGRSTRPYRPIGVLIKAPQSAENRPLAEFLRGVLEIMRPLRAGTNPSELSIGNKGYEKITRGHMGRGPKCALTLHWTSAFASDNS